MTKATSGNFQLLNEYVEWYEDNNQPEKGRTLRAIQDIQPGQKIFSDVAPLIKLETCVSWDDWKRDYHGIKSAWFQTEDLAAEDGAGQLADLIENLPLKTVLEFKRLWPGLDPDYIYHRADDHWTYFLDGCWDGPGPGSSSGSQEVAFLWIWKDISAIQWSCRPNVLIDFDRNGSAKVVALRDIPSGTEIVLNYMTDDWLSSRATRGKKLMELYERECECIDCTEKTFEEGDQLRIETARYDLQKEKLLSTGGNETKRLEDLSVIQRSLLLGLLTTTLQCAEILAGKDTNWIAW